jgi:hypothetical protein
VRFDITLGSDKSVKGLPSTEVLPELVRALDRPKNWDAQLPEGGEGLVNLRSVQNKRAREQAKESGGANGNGSDSEEEQPTPVVAHPLGTLTVRQSVVPLEYAIEKFGEGRPATYETFEIVSASVSTSGASARQAVEGKFAPAKYRKMSDAQKLDRKDFVDLDAGTTIGESGWFVDDDDENTTHATFAYEMKLTDLGNDNHNEDPVQLGVDPADIGAQHTSHTAETLVRDRAGPQDDGGGRFSIRDDSPGDEDDTGLFTVGADQYIVVDANTFEPIVTVDGDDGNGDDSPDMAIDAQVGTSKEDAYRKLEEYATKTDIDESDLEVVRNFRAQGDGQ